MTSHTPADTFPRQYARTLRYTVGAPRSFSVAPDGSRVVFLRSRSGSDRANLLWTLDTATGEERIAADPAVLLGGGEEDLSPAERARRERSREGSAGVVGYALDAEGRQAAFALSGRLFTADLLTGDARELPAQGPLLDPRISPDGAHVAYANTAGELRLTRTDGTGDRTLAEPEGPNVTWGQAEFIAQEEIDRDRGFWWSPDGERLLVERADDSPVRRWWIADPANPDREPAEVAYPAAGTPNAEVGLWLIDLQGGRTQVSWDHEAFPYLARVHWSKGGVPLLLVQSRDQRAQRVLGLDVATGGTEVLLEERDEAWLEAFPGVPAWTPDGKLVRISDEGGVRALVVGDQAVTGADLHLRSVVAVTEREVFFSASGGAGETDPEPGWIAVGRISHDGKQLSWESANGRPFTSVTSAVHAGGITVRATAEPDLPGTLVQVARDLPEGVVVDDVATVASYAETPVITARPVFRFAGERRIPSAVFLPTGYDRERDGLLPVLMDPYGGPHGQRVVQAHNPHLNSQWFADQGFAVVVADGRGTPGRGPAWEKSIAFDFAGATLDDQVEALRALAEEFPLDLGRVAIRGWSYGGYLSALAVLRRPDVFHAAVAGAPVAEWALYDTHYTERYLGHPAERPEVYEANSLTGYAAGLERPLMIIHGLADDNVVAAHTLRLSSALLAAGRPHTVLPLSGVTHMTPQEEVAENLLLLQVDFVKRSLGL
ncbi:prolyl oligopeptidase family serine peptidase [Kitasatospora aureofaciens]|uniref:Peptidase n=1 Tax=Kitasatospora aureofaciens TaxID=1894 RepID=A0A1E7NBU8_KITAU|nr:prolyl oligopeptidase family serine peptidase [Kitasatospora aureofaciens]ARF78854.1 S9 family peptidase [Kitasatospora aureofaciens]OEV38162.1 peptidase S9 [Kitasatospora aureofaciens]GGU76809.1 peptidase [Kitasatospora aureofaciens]